MADAKFQKVEGKASRKRSARQMEVEEAPPAEESMEIAAAPVAKVPVFNPAKQVNSGQVCNCNVSDGFVNNKCF